jgi:hypothetical protein
MKIWYLRLRRSGEPAGLSDHTISKTGPRDRTASVYSYGVRYNHREEIVVCLHGDERGIFGLCDDQPCYFRGQQRGPARLPVHYADIACPFADGPS